jgi:hypothetical protein
MHPILAAMPAPIRDLAARIESESTVPIEVIRSTPSCPDAAFRAAEAAVQIIPTKRGLVAQILQFKDQIQPEAALHELCHLEETLCKAIPQLVFSRGLETIEKGYIPPGSYVGSSAWLENKISHYRYVYKRMNELGFNQADGLNCVLGEQWRKVAPVARSAQNRMVPRMSVFTDYAITRRFCTDADVRSRAGAIIKSVGLLERARRFEERFNKALKDKAETVRVILHEFNLPSDIALLRYHDGPHKLIRDCDLSGKEIRQWRFQ